MLCHYAVLCTRATMGWERLTDWYGSDMPSFCGAQLAASSCPAVMQTPGLSVQTDRAVF